MPRAYYTSLLIGKIDPRGEVYEGTSFRQKRFKKWLARQRIPWPQDDDGALSLKAETFRTMADVYAPVAPLHEVRAALSELRLSSLEVGEDGFNRVLLSAFRAVTGRNQPSNAKFVFGPSKWIRNLIKVG